MIANVLLVKWRGGYVEAEDAASIATYGRREATVTCQADYEDAALAFGEDLLGVTASPDPAVTLGVAPDDPADEPYAAYGIGDVVTYSTLTSTESRRVVGITVDEDDDGNLTFAPEVNRVVKPAEQRMDDVLKSLGGAAQASPTERLAAQPVTFSGLGVGASTPAYSVGETGLGTGGRVVGAGAAAGEVLEFTMVDPDEANSPPIVSLSSSAASRFTGAGDVWKFDVQVRADQVDTADLEVTWYLNGVAQSDVVTLPAGDAFAQVEFAATVAVDTDDEVYVAVTDAGDGVASPPHVRLWRR